MLHELPGPQLDPLVPIGGPAQVPDALEVQLLQDALLANHVHLRGEDRGKV